MTWRESVCEHVIDANDQARSDKTLLHAKHTIVTSPALAADLMPRALSHRGRCNSSFPAIPPHTDLAAAVARATSGQSTKRMSWQHSENKANLPYPNTSPTTTGTGDAFVQSPVSQQLISPELQQRPSSSRNGSVIIDDQAGRKRKRSSGLDTSDDGFQGVDSSLMTESPSSIGKQRHQPGVKRACNDCRQQKVS